MTIVQPFKKESKHLYCNTLFMLILALFYIFMLQVRISRHLQPYYTHLFLFLAILVSVLPLLYLSALIVHWLYSHRRFGGQLVRTLQAWRRGYQVLD